MWGLCNQGRGTWVLHICWELLHGVQVLGIRGAAVGRAGSRQLLTFNRCSVSCWRGGHGGRDLVTAWLCMHGMLLTPQAQKSVSVLDLLFQAKDAFTMEAASRIRAHHMLVYCTHDRVVYCTHDRVRQLMPRSAARRT